MKITCEKCGQRYDVDEAYIGKTIICECTNEMRVPNRPINREKLNQELAEIRSERSLINCPDCGREVSKRASSCPGCGAPIAKESGQVKAPPAVKKPGVSIPIVATVFVIGGLAMFPLSDNPRYQVVAVAGGLIAVLIGIILLAVYSVLSERGKGFIICPNQNCNYQGSGKKSGGSSLILFLVLLLIGILPGIIYLLIVGHGHIDCPKCGIRIR